MKTVTGNKSYSVNNQKTRNDPNAGARGGTRVEAKGASRAF